MSSTTGRELRFMRAPFRRKNLRFRVLLPVAGGLLIFLWARPTLPSLMAGVFLIGAGQALRLWAAGHLVKTEQFTFTGPYRFLRHPLYAGAFLIGTGFMIAAGPPVVWIALPVGFAFFFYYYLPYKERGESRRLEARHGTLYRAYREQVRQIVPRLRPWNEASATKHGQYREAQQWHLERVIQNNELGTLVAVLLTLAAFSARFFANNLTLVGG